MALESLGGPFPITVEGVPARFFNDPMWYDGVGLVGKLFHGEEFNGCIVDLDGVAQVRQRFMPSWTHLTHNLTTGGAAVWSYYALGDYFEEFDLQTLLAKGGSVDGGNPWTVLADRWIRAYIGQIRTLPRGTVGLVSGTVEAVLTSEVGVGGSGWITPARPSTVFAAFPGGVAFEYDFVRKTGVGWKRNLNLTGVKGFFYSRELGIFISVHKLSNAQDVLRLWADEVRPVSVSVPAAVTPVIEGRVARIETRVAGDAADPCIGFLVDWSLAGPGSLSVPQSMTDEDGYARVDCLVPPGASGTGQVSATVVF